MLASGHPGLEIKVLYYILCTALSSQVQTNTATCRGRMHVNNVLSQTCELTYVIGHVNVCLHLWKLATWRFVCRGLSVPVSHLWLVLYLSYGLFCWTSTLNTCCFAYLTIELIFQIQIAYGSPLMEFLLFLYIIKNKIWSMWLLEGKILWVLVYYLTLVFWSICLSGKPKVFPGYYVNDT